MASPTLAPLPGAHDPELIPVPFRATLDGSNDATVVRGKRAIASITHTATGKFRITLREGFVALASAELTLKAPTVVALTPQLVADDVTPSSGGTVDFRLVGPTAAGNTAGVATDPPTAGTNATEIHGVLWVSNLSVT
jgi:hypothetical protein